MDRDILQAIGNTSLVRLRKLVPGGSAEIHAKLEWENPTGSVKDRMALAVIERAERDGRLKRGDTVIEYTGGSTGTSLAFVCAAKGYRIHIVTSDAFSQEKRDQMVAREEAVFAGTSSGANVIAALQVAERLGRGARVVTLFADTGLKYLSTDVYKR